MVLARAKKPNAVVLAEVPRVGDFIGYARVSTQEQILDLQIVALERFGCVNIYQEKVSGSGKQKRPQLDLAIKELQPGDTLVVWRLDRLARSMEEFHYRLAQIKAAGAKFKSLTENFDFDTAMGGFVLVILAAVAELERQLTVHRTKAGLAVAREKGVQLGANIKITDAVKLRLQRMAALDGDKRMTLEEIAKSEGIAVSSIFNVFPGGRPTMLKWKPAKKSKRI